MRQQTNERVGYGEDYKYSHDYKIILQIKNTYPMS
jgi:replication-associated recombination protein RarA